MFAEAFSRLLKFGAKVCLSMLSEHAKFILFLYKLPLKSVSVYFNQANSLWRRICRFKRLNRYQFERRHLTSFFSSSDTVGVVGCRLGYDINLRRCWEVRCFFGRRMEGFCGIIGTKHMSNDCCLATYQLWYEILLKHFGKFSKDSESEYMATFWAVENSVSCWVIKGSLKGSRRSISLA